MTPHSHGWDLPLRVMAQSVLRDNDTGTLVRAAPALYPHQWSWDAAFVSMGLATFDIPRAIAELEHLRGAQWPSGMIPHIVFGEGVGYFPDASWWETSGLSPAGTMTSGICQPAVHAIALRRIWQRAAGTQHRSRMVAYLERTLDSWVAWYRWLWLARAGDGSGLITIHHGWESGMDNSPRFDAAYARVEPGIMPPFRRSDTARVADPGERPSDEEYRRYLWLIKQMAQVGYRDEDVARVSTFQVKDVFASAIFSVGCADLAALADELGRTDVAGDLRTWSERSSVAVDATIDPSTGLARDRDLLTQEHISVPCISGFAPLLSTHDPQIRAMQEELLAGPDWLGATGLAHRVPCSTSPKYPGFDARRYWRGPSWPVITWFLAFQLKRAGEHEFYRQLRKASLAELADMSFAEYYQPFTAEPLGSRRQSWTASAALEWLAPDPEDGTGSPA